MQSLCSQMALPSFQNVLTSLLAHPEGKCTCQRLLVMSLNLWLILLLSRAWVKIRKTVKQVVSRHVRHPKKLFIYLKESDFILESGFLVVAAPL